MEDLKPKKRTRLRLFCGKLYYKSKRYMLWMSRKYTFSKEYEKTKLSYLCTDHKTPLLRKLKNLDMQLQYNKIENLRIAIKKIDGILIVPGETFSYWKLIGKPTNKKGYLPGMTLFQGSYQSSIGGGLCQLSNLIYWMALHTELTVTERYRHSYDVFPDSNRTQPFGSGATCVYNYRDLMLSNNSIKTFQLRIWMDETYLYGCIYSSSAPTEIYEVYEKEHYFKRELFGLYSRNNWIYRKIYSINHYFITEEFVTENHALMMYEPYIEDKKVDKP